MVLTPFPWVDGNSWWCMFYFLTPGLPLWQLLYFMINPWPPSVTSCWWVHFTTPMWPWCSSPRAQTRSDGGTSTSLLKLLYVCQLVILTHHRYAWQTLSIPMLLCISIHYVIIVYPARKRAFRCDPLLWTKNRGKRLEVRGSWSVIRQNCLP